MIRHRPLGETKRGYRQRAGPVQSEDLAAEGFRRGRGVITGSGRREAALELALPCGQPLQRGGHGIERALKAIHPVKEWLRIKLALGFELADALAATPPSDGEADGTDPEDLRRYEQRAEEKTRRIHKPTLARGLAAYPSARGRTRTCTGISSLGILSPLRLPFRHPSRFETNDLAGP